MPIANIVELIHLFKFSPYITIFNIKPTVINAAVPRIIQRYTGMRTFD